MLATQLPDNLYFALTSSSPHLDRCSIYGCNRLCLFVLSSRSKLSCIEQWLHLACHSTKQVSQYTHRDHARRQDRLETTAVKAVTALRQSGGIVLRDTKHGWLLCSVRVPSKDYMGSCSYLRTCGAFTAFCLPHPHTQYGPDISQVQAGFA